MGAPIQVAESSGRYRRVKGQTKAEELGAPGSLVRAVSQEKLMQNGGTEGAPRGDGPSLKKHLGPIHVVGKQ